MVSYLSLTVPTRLIKNQVKNIATMITLSPDTAADNCAARPAGSFFQHSSTPVAPEHHLPPDTQSPAVDPQQHNTSHRITQKHEISKEHIPLYYPRATTIMRACQHICWLCDRKVNLHGGLLITNSCRLEPSAAALLHVNQFMSSRGVINVGLVSGSTCRVLCQLKLVPVLPTHHRSTHRIPDFYFQLLASPAGVRVSCYASCLHAS